MILSIQPELEPSPPDPVPSPEPSGLCVLHVGDVEHTAELEPEPIPEAEPAPQRGSSDPKSDTQSRDGQRLQGEAEEPEKDDQGEDGEPDKDDVYDTGAGLSESEILAFAFLAASGGSSRRGDPNEPVPSQSNPAAALTPEPEPEPEHESNPATAFTPELGGASRSPLLSPSASPRQKMNQRRRRSVTGDVLPKALEREAQLMAERIRIAMLEECIPGSPPSDDSGQGGPHCPPGGKPTDTGPIELPEIVEELQGEASGVNPLLEEQEESEEEVNAIPLHPVPSMAVHACFRSHRAWVYFHNLVILQLVVVVARSEMLPPFRGLLVTAAPLRSETH